ncbi:MAG: hypothetical protein GX259_09355 [Bacteroidales bacterium]|nr:hypothetical protein [Bacteroidales bacterium]
MLLYIAFRIMLFFLYLMPFRLIYVFSDFTAFLLHKVIKYRKDVVYNNLSKSFPQKTKKEIKKYAAKFYRNFSDVMLESGKGYITNPKKIKKRYVFSNVEILNQYYENGKSIILQMGHFNNWEWLGMTLSYDVFHKIFAIYRPLKNRRIDAYIKKAREKRQFNIVPMANTGLMFRNIAKQPCIFVLISDQSPTQSDKAYWTYFLNQETGFLHGTEIYSKKFKLPIVFAKVIRIKRGYYKIDFIPIADENDLKQEGKATINYAKMLEKTIIEQPTSWLWSHRRWKRERPKDKEILEF